jgi:NAD(P)-dependent dehydrogenase (short-subunit alcohol dehydrogenase family)
VRSVGRVDTALVTGASRGLGLALARALAARGLRLAIDARGEEALLAAGAELARSTEVVALAGDIAEEAHRHALIAAAGPRLSLLVNNASLLGPSPQPRLADYPLAELERVYAVNTLAPLRLAQLAIPALERNRGTLINITSDAAVEAYEGWGGYGSSKAALEQLSAVLAAEHPRLSVHAVDPGDMRTQMQQEAFPGEDISDRPAPEESVPGLLALIDGKRPSGRHRVADLVAAGS